MITVWGRPDSSAVSRVMWTIGELELPHRRIDAGGEFGGLDAPDYRALNPSGRIPAVVLEDGRALWESCAIIRFLAARHSTGRLMPADDVARAQAEAWMDWSASFGSAVGAIRKAYKATGASRDSCRPAVTAAGPAFGVLSGRLRHAPYLCGDRLTVADLAFGPALHRLMRCPAADNGLDVPAELADWYARLASRPAFVAHVVAQVSAGAQTLGG